MAKIMLQAFLLFVSAGVIGCASPSRYSTGPVQFNWPVKSAKISQKYRTHGRKRHQGIDIRGRTNTPIYATAAGKVIYVGSEFNGFGRLVIVEHQGDRWASFYAHLNRYKVREGQRVKAGDLLGLMGRSGNATGTHLHFEIRHNRRAIDPLDVLPPTRYLGAR